MSVTPVRPTCLHCIFWVSDHTSDPPTVGHCHRFPPGVTVNPETGVIVQKFPTTERRQWCGEWSDDEEALAAAAKRTMIHAAT